MQRGLVEKHVLQQLRRHVRVHDRPGSHDAGEVHASLEDDQRAGFGRRHIGAGLHGLGNGGLQLGRRYRPCRRKAAAHTLEQAAQLRLEQHDQRQQSDLDGVRQQKIDHPQIEDIAQQKGDQNDQDALGDIIGIGSADKPDRLIDDVSDDQNVQYIGDTHRRQNIQSSAKTAADSFHKQFPVLLKRILPDILSITILYRSRLSMSIARGKSYS